MAYKITIRRLLIKIAYKPSFTSFVMSEESDDDIGVILTASKNKRRKSLLLSDDSGDESIVNPQR